MSRVTHFELAAKDPERFMKFYKDTFGWWFKKWDGPFEYWMIMTGSQKLPGIDGGLCRGEGPGASINTIDVDDIDSYIKKVEEAGGKIISQKTAIQGVGWLCYFEDTEGNQFGMMERDENAK
jgi:predicted enzyme related to lactoylglutathione lyase